MPGRKRIMKAAVRVLGVVAVILVATWLVIAQPSFHSQRRSAATVQPAKLRGHVEVLAQQFGPRDWEHTEDLDRCADYLAEQFRQAGATVEFQPFRVQHRQYRNVIARFGVGKGNKVVVGAHYDACDALPGADDNASGVAALIELAGLLGSTPPNHEVELVAYVLEEPPFFATPSMGSAVHAKRLAAQHDKIRGVIVLEMVGYFRDDWGSQSYPNLLLHLMYPSRGNFITVASRFDQGAWLKTVKTRMQGTTALPVYSIRAPTIVPGIDFSDHANYWEYGYPALMVTDTAFYRNKAYHSASDTPDRLDYQRLAQVVVAVFEAMKAL